MEIIDGSLTLIDKISPTYISEKNPKYLEIDNMYFSSLIVVDYQKEYSEIIWKNIVDLDSNIQISMFYQKKDKYKTIKDITYYIGNSGASIKEFNNNRQDIDLLSFSYEDAKYIRQQLQINNDELYNIYVYITVMEKEPNLLEYELNKVQSILYSNGLITRRANFRQLETYENTLPIFKNNEIVANISRRNILGSSLVVTYPFILSTINDKTGILLGCGLYNNSLVIIDRFKRKIYKNSNMCIFGTSGSGKSYFTKLNILREFLNGITQYIIDPEGEYSDICKYLGSEIIKIGPSSKEYINILDIRKEEATENYLLSKLLKLKSFFYLIFNDINNEDYALLEEKLILMYKNHGITFDDNSLYENIQENKIIIEKVFKKPNKMPILEDLYELIKNDTQLKKYANQLKIFVHGGLKFFNHHTNVNLNNRLIVSDIHELGEENYKYGMFLFIDTFWNKIKENNNLNKIIYIDEIWRIIGISSNAETANFIYKIFKTIRKYGGGAVAITQDVSDVFSLHDGSYGKSIINNSSIKCLFNLSEENIDIISKNIKMSEQEQIEIKKFNRGEMLLIAEDNHLPVHIISSEYEKNIIG